jgi:hypothetical protein
VYVSEGTLSAVSPTFKRIKDPTTAFVIREKRHDYVCMYVCIGVVTSARPFRSTARPPTSPRRVSSFECAGSPPAPPSPGQHKRISM